MPKATARHILVSTEAKCNELKAAIEGGADFAQGRLNQANAARAVAAGIGLIRGEVGQGADYLRRLATVLGGHRLVLSL